MPQPSTATPIALGQPFALAPDCPVDTHFHIFQAHQAIAGARYVPAYTAHLADWAALAQGQGVQRGVLVQPSFLGIDNGMMLAALQAHPALRGVAVVAPDADLDPLPAWHALGVRGIRLNLAGASHDVSAWRAAPALWAMLAQLGWHLQLHTDAGALPGVLRQFEAVLPEGLPVVLDHCARPCRASLQDDTLLALGRWSASGRPVYVKLSGHYRLGDVQASPLVRLLHEVLGPERLLWGSDWPCTNHEQHAQYATLLHTVLDALGAVVGDATAAQALLTRNAHRLYA